jgi:hypothetical protein
LSYESRVGELGLRGLIGRRFLGDFAGIDYRFTISTTLFGGATLVGHRFRARAFAVVDRLFLLGAAAEAQRQQKKQAEAQCCTHA